MKIRLREIPAEGRSYTYDRKGGELNADLDDLINTHDYVANLHIKPIGDAYEMRGDVRSTLNELCSKCGWEIEIPVDRKFHEILVEEQEDYRKSHSVHGNQSVDFLGEGVSSVPYRQDIFDPGEYVHEAIALAAPFYPTCGPNETCFHEAEVKAIIEKLEAEFEAADEKTQGHPAFSALKAISLAQKN